MSTLADDAPMEMLDEGRQSTGKRVPPGGMRALLRDTALLATTLGQGGNTESIPVLRERCRELISQLADRLAQRGIASDVQQDVLYAQCGLLDEVVLRHLPTKDKCHWDALPLQVEKFGKHDAGDHVFERLAEHMRETPPNADLLEAYSTILGLGLMGRYAREGEATRTAIIASLDAQLTKLRPGTTRMFSVDHSATRLVDWFYRLSPWAIAGLGCAGAAIVYLSWSHALDLQLAHLLAVKP